MAAAEAGPQHRGGGGGEGAAEFGPSERCPPAGGAGAVLSSYGGTGSEGQGRTDRGTRAREGESFPAIGEALRRARAAAACGPARPAGPGPSASQLRVAGEGLGLVQVAGAARVGRASQPVRSTCLLSCAAKPQKIDAQIVFDS